MEAFESWSKGMMESDLPFKGISVTSELTIGFEDKEQVSLLKAVWFHC